MALPSASVGRRSTGRSVSRAQLLASRKVGVGISCNMSGSWNNQTKRAAGSPPPPWSLLELRRFNRTRRTHGVHRLFGRSFRHRDHRYEGAAVGFCTKLDMTFDLGKQSM